MQQKVVVVVPPSPSKIREIICWKCQASGNALPFCASCGALQDLPTAVSHFDVLALAPSLKQDDAAMRERFYELSRKLHPDRYATAAAPESTYSLRWTTALNRAYQTLRDKVGRTQYLLELFEVPPNKSSQVPIELAEAYFELQDLIGDPKSTDRMKLFRGGLEQLYKENEATWDDLATNWDASAEKKSILQNLQAYLNKRRYLSSMISDLEKKIGSESGNRWH